VTFVGAPAVYSYARYVAALEIPTQTPVEIP
jgi:hypothetical protein